MNQDQSEKPLGRPTLKTPDRTEKIFELAKQGKTDLQIAEIIGVSERTIYNWKSQDWEFSACLKENKQLADDIVEATLFKKATGFEKTYITEKATKDGAVTVEETVYVPPSDTAMIFWLKNRQPKQWRDKTESEIVVKQQLFGSLTQEELVKMLEIELQKAKAIDVQSTPSEE